MENSKAEACDRGRNLACDESVVGPVEYSQFDFCRFIGGRSLFPQEQIKCIPCILESWHLFVS